MILEIAKTVGLPLFVFDISSMDNTEFKKYIDIVEHLPGILLFEDIDSIFTGRDNLVKGRYGSLTFDFFINQLSGISSIRNKFIFFTTNYLEKLDPALIRPGRVDEIVEVKPLTLDEKKKLAGIFIEDDMAAVEKCVADGRDDTTAQFENRCTKIVLERIWKPSTG
jgi:SpoVK/Ycf46/Vps4 family AAA+-type ATPase